MGPYKLDIDGVRAGHGLMHPLRIRFVDHVLFVGLALEISCTAVAIVDGLHDNTKMRQHAWLLS